MASCYLASISHRFCTGFRHPFSQSTHGNKSLFAILSNSKPDTSKSLIQTRTFTWEDAFEISQTGVTPSSNLHGYLEKVRLCNRGSVMQSDFVPFVIEGQMAGYVHRRFMDHLRNFEDVFTFQTDNMNEEHSHGQITLHSSLKSPEDRTEAVGEVIRSLGEDLVPGIRNEMYPVMSAFGMPSFFSLERAAAPYFGIKAYGVHMNGYVLKGGEKFLWVGKRSNMKPTFPGMLDHLVAGGIPHGISCRECLLKECEEEAGIPRAISSTAVPVGAVSYMDIDGYRCKRDVLFCYDLELPDGFTPANEDGEVESFKLIPVPQVAEMITSSEFFKPNCNLVIIDFLFRHGFLSPEEHGYLELLQSLKRGDCS